MLPTFFFSTGIRLRLRFSSSVFGPVSLSTGNSILPRIFGPSNFSAFIFSIIRFIFHGFRFYCFFNRFWFFYWFFGFSFFFCFFNRSSVSLVLLLLLSFFFASFLGLVEESIVSRSILSITLGVSISGASIFMISAAVIGCSFICFWLISAFRQVPVQVLVSSGSYFNFFCRRRCTGGRCFLLTFAASFFLKKGLLHLFFSLILQQLL